MIDPPRSSVNALSIAAFFADGHSQFGAVADREFDELLGDCEHHRLLGLVGEAVRTGALPVTARQRDQVEERVAAWLAHALRVERSVLATVSILDSIGIEHRILKGVALAHLVYPDPSRRVFGDADILIRSQDFARAALVLAERLGGTRAWPELRGGFDTRFGREITIRIGRLELDLHRTLVDGPFGLWIVLDELWGDPQPFELGGRRLFALSPEAQLIHSCYAAALGDWPPRWAPRRDIVELLRAGTVDSLRVVALATSWRGRAVVAHALNEATTALGMAVDHELAVWARAYRASPVERTVLRSYRGKARGYTSQALSVLAMPGLRDRAAYVRAIMAPDAAYREARDLPAGGLVRRAWQRWR